MQSTAAPSRCWAEIDLAALRHNVEVARRRNGSAAALMAVVKADAYGHGMVPVARELALGSGIRLFGVASLAEARRLQAELPADLLPGVTVSLLSPALPDEREEILRRRVVPWLSTAEETAAYAAAAERIRDGATPAEPFDVEIEVDTGMGRSGVLERDFPKLRELVETLPALRLRGVVTHLPVPDEETAFTREQLGRFVELLVAGPPLLAGGRLHAQNSAGLLGYPLAGGCNVVRPGLMLYGASPLPDFQKDLRPVLTLKTRVTLVRELPQGWGVSYGRTFIAPQPIRVATLAAGYGDGYPRHLSGTGADVLVRGRRCPLLGRVTMDQIMVDVSALETASGSAVAPGEEAVLLGRQRGADDTDADAEILAGELAALSGTIPWEIFTGLTSRVARRYLNGTLPSDG